MKVPPVSFSAVELLKELGAVAPCCFLFPFNDHTVYSLTECLQCTCVVEMH